MFFPFRAFVLTSRSVAFGAPYRLLQLHGKSRFFAHTASGLMSDPKASYKIYAQEPDISAYRLFAEAEGDPGRGDVARDQGVDKTTEALTSMSISRQDVPATPAPNVPRERHFGPHSDKPRPANAGPRYHQHRGTGLGPLDGDFEPRFDGKVSFSVNQKDPFRLSSADRYNLRNLLPDDPDKQFLTEDGVRRFVGSFVEDWSGVYVYTRRARVLLSPHADGLTSTRAQRGSCRSSGVRDRRYRLGHLL